MAPRAPLGADAAMGAPRFAPRDHERRWETALRTPFRVAFFPLRLVADGLEASASFVGPRYFDPKPKATPKHGPVLTPAVTLGVVDEIGVGPALNWNAFPTANAKLHVAGTWSAIDRRRASFSEVIGDGQSVSFRMGVDYDHTPNRPFYGIGDQSAETDLSYVMLATTEAQAAFLLGASPLRQLRLMGGYSSMSPSRAYNSKPLLEDVFTPAGAPFEDRTTRELWYGASGDLAVLDDRRDPSRGLHGRFDLRHAAGLRGSDPDYDQWRLEGRAYLPVFAKRRVIAIRTVYAGVDPAAGTSSLPFYRLVESDGSLRFAGYSAERFRDRQLVLGRIEYRWAVSYRLSALALYERGEVASDTQAFTLHAAHEAYGGGLRVGLSDQSALRCEIAKSVEGLHATLSLGGDF